MRVVADFTEAQRDRLASQGKARRDGSFPIRNRSDLQNAIRAVGRVRPNTEAERSRVRRHIIRRARAIGAMEMVPDTWGSDGTLKG